jgi:pimeloyl-ACP methyl ester carboxylesterase
MIGASSYAELMAEPVLKNVRLVAVTLPGNAGAPPIGDLSIEATARGFAALAAELRPDVVVGFSNGASVAYEMVVSGAYRAPVVLLGVSLSAKAESGFFLGIVGLSALLGTLPMRFMKKVAGALTSQAPIAPERRRALKAEFAKNDVHDLRRALMQYRRWLRRGHDPARRLCDAGVPAFVVHAEKAGDGGLTPHERAVLEGCSHVRIVTLPGKVFFIPNEVPARVAEIIVEALDSAER